MTGTQVGWLGFGIVLVVSLALLLRPSASERATVRSKLAGGAVVLDVRTPAEFGAGHYPGAVNAPVQDLQANLGALGLKPDQAIVVYCRSGNRSRIARGILMQADFTDVTNGGSLADLTR